MKSLTASVCAVQAKLATLMKVISKKRSSTTIAMINVSTQDYKFRNGSFKTIRQQNKVIVVTNDIINRVNQKIYAFPRFPLVLPKCPARDLPAVKIFLVGLRSSYEAYQKPITSVRNLKIYL